METAERSHARTTNPNVGRAASIIAGTALAYVGVRKRTILGAGLALAGGELIRRGASNGRRSEGIHVDRAITINKPREEVFAFWRDLENLPRFMKHLKSVKAESPTRSHWVATGPGGRDVEWDADIICESDGRMITWRSVPGTGVENSGSVRFHQSPGGRGTEVRVCLQYYPPLGYLGTLFAKLFGEAPEQQITGDLRRLRAMLETGQIANSASAFDTKPHAAQEKQVRQALEETFPTSDAPAYY